MRRFSPFKNLRTAEDDARFVEKVTKKENGCWIFNGSTVGGKGLKYGNFSLKGHLVTAHRYSYALHNPDFDENLCVLHRCDNPRCVNPEHLFQGTQHDNVMDMIKKRRHRLNKKRLCIRGHSLEPEDNNVYFIGRYKTARQCIMCTKMRSRNKK